MNKSVLTLLLIAASLPAQASSVASQKSAFLKKCNGDGETRKTCECIFNRWSNSIQAHEQKAAGEFTRMFITNTPPDPAQMAQIQPLMMRFQQTGMQCAQQNLGADDEPTFDVQTATGGKTNDDAADLINNAQNMSSAEIIANLQAMDDKRDAERNKRDAEKQKQQHAAQSKRDQLWAAYEQEMDSIGYVVTQLPVNRFKKAFTLKGKASNTSGKVTSCKWKKLTQSAGNGPAASLTAYCSLVGCDFDQPAEHRPHMDEAWKRLNKYNKKASSCG